MITMSGWLCSCVRAPGSSLLIRRETAVDRGFARPGATEQYQSAG